MHISPSFGCPSPTHSIVLILALLLSPWNAIQPCYAFNFYASDPPRGSSQITLESKEPFGVVFSFSTKASSHASGHFYASTPRHGSPNAQDPNPQDMLGYGTWRATPNVASSRSAVVDFASAPDAKQQDDKKGLELSDPEDRSSLDGDSAEAEDGDTPLRMVPRDLDLEVDVDAEWQDERVHYLYAAQVSSTVGLDEKASRVFEGLVEGSNPSVVSSSRMLVQRGSPDDESTSAGPHTSPSVDRPIDSPLIAGTVMYIPTPYITLEIVQARLKEYEAKDDVWASSFLSCVLIQYDGKIPARFDRRVLGYLGRRGVKSVLVSGRFDLDKGVSPGARNTPKPEVLAIASLEGENERTMVEPGPYIFAPFSTPIPGSSSSSNSIFISLHTVYRLYPDDLEAFMIGSIPDLENGGWIATNITIPHKSDNNDEDSHDHPPQLIPVPSRIPFFRSSFSQISPFEEDDYHKVSKAKPLLGLRFGLKDIFDAQNLPTSAGSLAYLLLHPGSAQTSTAPPIQKLIDLGAVLVGKTRTSQFAHGADGWEYADFGYSWNPRGDGWLTCGSSSSGSACAVAGYGRRGNDAGLGMEARSIDGFGADDISEGWLDFAVGSDTRGSIRKPASHVGVFGIRPSWGMWGMDLSTGVVPLSEEMDTVGFFVKDREMFGRIFRAWYAEAAVASTSNQEHQRHQDQVDEDDYHDHNSRRQQSAANATEANYPIISRSRLGDDRSGGSASPRAEGALSNVDINKNITRQRQRQLLYPIDHFPVKNPRAQMMIDGFVERLERYLGARKVEVNMTALLTPLLRIPAGDNSDAVTDDNATNVAPTALTFPEFQRVSNRLAEYRSWHSVGQPTSLAYKEKYGREAVFDPVPERIFRRMREGGISKEEFEESVRVKRRFSKDLARHVFFSGQDHYQVASPSSLSDWAGRAVKGDGRDGDAVRPERTDLEEREIGLGVGMGAKADQGGYKDSDGAGCAESDLFLYDIGTGGVPSYRLEELNSLEGATGSVQTGGGRGEMSEFFNYIASMGGLPEVTVPVGTVEYLSPVSREWERMAVCVQIVAARGCEGIISEIVTYGPTFV